MAQITVSAGSTTTVPIAAGQKVILTGQGIYRVSGLGGSQRPTVDESIDTTSTVGPFGDTCSVQVWGAGAGAVYEVVSTTDALDQTGRPSSVSGACNLVLEGALVGQSSSWVQFAPDQRIAYALDSGSTASTAAVDFGFDGVTTAGQAYTISYASSTQFEVGILAVSAYFVALALAAKRAGTFRGYYFKVTVQTGGPLSVYINV